MAEGTTAMDANTTLAWVNVRTTNAHDMRAAISEVEKFTGEIGDLAHFLKAGERITNAINAKAEAGWLDNSEVPALRAALANRISRQVLNLIQADEETPWELIKGRLKKAFGGARWAPEEDVLRLIREEKRTRQSAGEFATKLLEGFASVAEKLGEQGDADAARIKMSFLEGILKAQLRRELGKVCPPEKSFQEAVHEIVDEGAREEEESMLFTRNKWTEVKYGRERKSAREPPRRNYADYAEKRIRRAPRAAERRRDTKEEKRCYECGSPKHLAARCGLRKCFECGETGHLARKCPHISRGRAFRPEPMEVNAQGVSEVRRRNEVRSSRGSASSGVESESDTSASSVWTVRPRRAGVPKRKEKLA